MAKKLILTILHILFSYVAVAVIIIVEFALPSNAWQYKISLAGLVLFVVIVIIAKRQFVKSYQNKMNELLEGLATALTADEKGAWKRKLKRHKVVMAVIESIDTTLPLLILMIATSWAGSWLTHMSGVIGMCWLAMMIGECFRIWKRVGGGGK